MIKTRIIQINVQLESRDKHEKDAINLNGTRFIVKHLSFYYIREILIRVTAMDSSGKFHRVWSSQESSEMPYWIGNIERTVVKPELLSKTEKYKPIRKTPDRRKA